MEHDPFDPAPEWCYFTADDTLGGLLSIYANGDEVASRLQLNLQSQGSDTIAEVAQSRCEESADLLLKCAELLQAKTNLDDEDWGEYSVPDLIEHIKEYHHRMTYAEVGRLGVLVGYLRQVQPHDELGVHYHEFSEHLVQHLQDEEERLFPQWLQYDGSHDPSTEHYRRVDRDVRVIEHHHEDLGDDLKRVVDVVRQLTAEGESARVIPALLAGIEMLQEDLNLAHKEDEYLMPALLYMRELNRRRYRYHEEP